MIYEETGSISTQVGNYLRLNPELPEEDRHTIGVWGQCCRRYLREHRQAIYATLLTGGRLNSYLADIDSRAEELFPRQVKQMSETEGVTEMLKTDNRTE